MAVYTTFFLCEPEEVAGGFPGWKPPLDKPRTVERVNPFTGEPLKGKTTSRTPEWTSAERKKIKVPKPKIVDKSDSYEAYLENRIPPLVQSKAHWCAKGLTSVEMLPLVVAATKSKLKELEMPLYAPPDFGGALEAFPGKFVEALSKLKAADKKRLAKSWAETEELAAEECTPKVALAMLEDLIGLAAQSQKGQTLYLLTEV